MRLSRRALARPLVTLAAALLLTGLVVTREARKVRFYHSRVVFRVVGGDETPKRALRQLVQREVLSDETLLDLIKRHHIDDKLSPLDAVEYLRDDQIAMEIWRNPDTHVMLGFADRDPKLAYEIVCELMELVQARTANPAVARADRELQRARDEEGAAREALFAARSSLARKELTLLQARDRTRLVAEIEAGRAQVAAGEQRLAQKEGASEAARALAQTARQQLSLRFEVVEPPRPQPLVADAWKRLLRLALLAFFLLLPLAALAVGAYDPTVRDAADLERLGIRPLGQVPGFPGDGVGSLDERERRMRYASRQ
jgi:hypothetical protein